MSGASARNLPEGQWRYSQGVRYWRSWRHFTGDHEDTNREVEHSEVINTIGMFDSGLAYALSDRVSLQLALPLQLAQRSLPVRNAARETVDRDVHTANGPGDLGLGLRAWLIDPAPDQPYNLEVGLGLKLPTGATGVQGARRAWDAQQNAFVTSVQHVDQSIMPGDSGYGALVQLNGYWDLPYGVTSYMDGAYLLNPMDNSGIATGRTRPSEAFMTIADQYLLRAGLGTAVPGVPGLGAHLGARWDGVPVRDLIGTSLHFRRPGYTVALDPGLSYAWGRQVLTVGVPWALYRNRLRSVTDEMDGTNGDAAFADYMLTATYSITFGP